jgi:hypothetical protein
MDVSFDEDAYVWNVKPSDDSSDDQYDQVVMGFSFGVPEDLDMKHHSIAIAGRRSLDGGIDVLSGYTGRMDDVLEKLVELKDQFWVTRCYVDDPENEMMRQIRALPGFSYYPMIVEAMTNRERYAEPKKEWEFFRRFELVCGTTSANWIIENWGACLVAIEGLMFRKRVTVPRVEWQDLRRFLRRPWHKNTLRSSVFRAMCLAVLPMVEKRGAVAVIPDAPVAYSGG